MPQLAEPSSPGHNAHSYHGKAKTIRTATHRMILHNDGFIELYDHRSTEQETKNVADENPELCEQLKQLIAEKQAIQKSN